MPLRSPFNKSPFKGRNKAPIKNFGPGCPVIVKRTGLPAIIRESQGTKTWKIELVDMNNGSPTGLFKENMKSQMMRKPRDNEFPVPANEDQQHEDSHDADKATTENNAPAIEAQLKDDTNEVEIQVNVPNQATVPTASLPANNSSDSSQSKESSDSLSLSSSLAPDNHSVQDSKNDGSSQRASSNTTDSESERDPDEEDEEDLPRYENEYLGGDALDVNDFACIRGIEKDESKYKAKFQMYLAEKQALLDDAWTVTKGPPQSNGLDVGDKVEQRRGEKRVGAIVGDDREAKGPPLWSVLFDGDATPTRKVPSTQLKVVRDQRVFTWQIIDDVSPNRPVDPYDIHGVVGFDFRNKFNPTQFESDDGEYDFPFLLLLQHLWPGDWRRQLHSFNTYIQNHNEGQRRTMSTLSENEWWVFWGIIFAACPAGKSGEKLFESKSSPRRLIPGIDISTRNGKKIMSWDRFKKIKERVQFAFYDRNDEDPWSPIASLIQGYNDKRKLYIASSILLVLDEAMSNFQPRTSKTSLLPFLSWIFRKPKPLGTEYKNVACSRLRIALFLEVQKGKLPMRLARFVPEVGVTAACSLRLIIASVHCGLANQRRRAAQQKQKRHLIVADSWFGSVKLCETLRLLKPTQRDDGSVDYVIDRNSGENPEAHEGIFAIKANHSYFPKSDIEKKMQKWPSGSHLVMKTVCPGSNITLYALGYKYNSRKVLCFVMTANAGSTAPGSKPYIARFQDKHGNLVERKVPRPEVIATFFGTSNVIDSLNHSRQHLLGLERLWRTMNPWFRNDITIIGMTAIDCLKAIHFHCPHFKDLTVEEYADRLAYDCVNNPYSSKAENPRGYIEPDGLAADEIAPILGRAGGSGMPSFVFGHGAGDASSSTRSMAEQITLCCGDTGISPLSFSGASTTFFGVASADHDTRTQRAIGAGNRPAKRRCFICHMDTRSECNNQHCMSHKYEYDGIVYDGIPLCRPSVGARTHMAKYGPANQMTCLQIHRMEVRNNVVQNQRGRS